MKKLVSILLALAMLFSFTMTAFAAEDTTLTINGEDGRSYVGHKLLGLTTSLKTGEHHPTTCDNVNHASDCYNYAYTVMPAYRGIFQEEVFNNGGNYLWEGSTKPATSNLITDDQILMYLANQTSDNGNEFRTMRQVADRLYRAIVAAGINPDKTDLTGTNDTIDQGYWMIVDKTENLDGYDAHSLVMVDTKGQDALTVTPKISLPTVEKKVKDIDNSEDNNIEDNAWHDSADHDKGDTIPFKLTGTLPSNVQMYQSYKMIFHDTLSAGLTLKKDDQDKPVVKVLMYSTKYRADADTALGDGTDVTAYFNVTDTGLTDGCSFEVSCENVFAIAGTTKDTAFVVYYEAILNENAVMGKAGNENKVFLEFSNDPYGEGTGKTEEDTVMVFTYQVVVNKVDSHNHPLKGAGFTLYKESLDGTYHAIGTELKGDDMTTFTWTHLDDGDYKLVETTVPEGYNKMSDLVFSITAQHETNGTPDLISLDGGQMGTGVVDTGAITKSIENKTGTVLPETGAQGTFMLLTVGSMMVMVAVVFMVTRKRMSIYED